MKKTAYGSLCATHAVTFPFQVVATNTSSVFCYGIRAFASRMFDQPAFARDRPAAGSFKLPAHILRIMRLLTFFLFAASLTVSARPAAQTVTLSGKDLSLKQVFTDIEKQTSFVVLSNEELLSNTKPVSLTADDMLLRDLLDVALKGQSLGYIIQGKTIFISRKFPIASLPQVTSSDRPVVLFETPPITGLITDSTGSPLAGATIAIKGKNKTTTSNSEGIFSLDVSEGDVLHISFVGHETRVIRITQQMVAGGGVGLVRLAPAEASMEEITIEANTGYQRIKPNELNGSIVTIDNKTLNQQVGTNILKRLDGVTSGLSFFTNKSHQNPQSDLNISIRGLSTINGPLNPLVVLDDFIYEGDINNINPNDIESVSILKDAAATSIYGARGGNGVIVLTTKKWKTGQPTTIEFNSNVIVSEKPDLFYVSQMSSADYIEVEQFLYRNGYYNDMIDYQEYFQKPFSPALQTFLDRKNGLINMEDSTQRVNQLKGYDIRNDYEKYFYTKAVTQQYAINIRGGGNNNSYTFSGAVDRNKGTNYDLLNKVNLNFQNVYQPLRNLRLNIGAYYTNSTATSGTNTWSVRFDGKPIPYLRLADDNGNPLPIPTYNKTYTDTIGSGKLLDWNFYPLDDYKYQTAITKTEDLVANIGINYTLLKGFNIDLKYQYQRQTANQVQNSTVESFYTRDMINRYSQIDYATGDIKYIIPYGDIRRLSNSVTNSQNLRLQANYQRQWLKHGISGIVGAEVREITLQGDQNTLYGYSEDPLGAANLDYTNRYPTLPFGYTSTIGSSVSQMTYRDNRFVSVYSNLSYLYNNKYSFSASIRRDGANILGVSTNDKWKPLWSAGLGWQLSKENFYNLDFFPYLKIRTSYGYSGNLDLSKTALPVASYFINRITNLPATQIRMLNNPGLSWEESRQFNLGLDFNSKNNIISGSIDFYTKKGKNLYGQTNYDYTTWGYMQQITKNVADMTGKGIDLRLVSKNIDRGFKWNTELLLNYNESKVTAYYTTDAEIGNTLIGNAGTTIIPVIGQPLYGLVAYHWMGLDSKGDPQGILNGQASTDWVAIFNNTNSKGINGNESVKFIGSAAPSVYGSLINTFSYRRASISFNINYRFGYYFKKPTLSYDQLFSSGGIGTNDFSKRWQQPGDELITNVPAMVYTNYDQFSYRQSFYYGAEIHYLKGDHLRLQYINLSYELKIPSSKSKVKNARLYANTSNLGLIWTANKEHIDPDYPTSFKPVKSFAMGIQLTF